VQEKRQDKIKVLVVDDSRISQKLYEHIITADERFELAGIAADGEQAVELTAKLKPDVISMDLNMPRMDGMEATRQIMYLHPLPVIVVSSLYDSSQQEMAFQVLEAGAVHIMPKPEGPAHPNHKRTVRQYLNALASMSEVKVVRRKPSAKSDTGKPLSASNDISFSGIVKSGSIKLLVIGASAGGPEGVKAILSAVGPDFPLPILIVQHIDPHFAEAFMQWLQTHTSMPLVMCGEDTALQPGKAYLAPGDKHLAVKSEGIITVSTSAPLRGHRPSVSYLFSSAAKVYHNKVIAVLLSGMGTDGAEDLKHLKDIGAITFAQNEESCLVFGMPGEAVKIGGACAVLPPDKIISEIKKILHKPNH
jgi:two-component system, chemotaxis family, protein-glutamate methylesterase/glutaminase